MLKKFVFFKLKSVLRRIILHLRIEPKQHIFILGKEKSGTTAIAKLLSHYTNKNLKSDIPEFWEVEDKLYSGELSFIEFYKNHKILFKDKIIKEPGLTYIPNELVKLFPNSKVIMIVRDPRDNIKSVFSRLNISGKIESFNDIDFRDMNKSWVNVLTNNGLGLNSYDPITNAAKRWCIAVNHYINNPDNYILLRYEDFVGNKLQSISELAKKLKLKKVNNINDLLEVNFQPKADKSISHLEFFGKDNLKKINIICQNEMNILGYE